MNIYFEKEAWDKINAYIKLADGEISGIGQAVQSKDFQDVIVKNVWIWPQVCGAAETEVVSQQDVINLVMELQKEGISTEELCVWWHSHADMKAFFSGTDTDTIEQWVNDKFLVSVCGNKAGEFVGRIDIKRPFPCVLDKVPVSRYNAVSPEIYETIKKEIEEKVTPRTYTYPGANGQMGFNQRDDDDYSYGRESLLAPAKAAEKLDRELEHEQVLTVSAQDCGCPYCESYLTKGTKFKYKYHTFNKTSGVYELKPEYYHLITDPVRK